MMLTTITTTTTATVQTMIKPNLELPPFAIKAKKEFNGEKTAENSIGNGIYYFNH
jgi:hypothetical protein